MILTKQSRFLCGVLATLLTLQANAITLNILEWEGYVSPFKDEFSLYAKSKGMDVQLNIVKPFITGPELIFKELRTKNVDVTTPTNNYYKMNQEKLLQVLQPIDFSKLSNYSQVLKSLRNASYDQDHSGKYSVPLLGGSYGLAYNANTTSAPDSWNALWDPKYKGKYAITSDQFEANIYITMLALGYSPESVYDISKGEFNESEVQQKLNQLVANAGSFWQGLADAKAMENLELVTTYWFGVADANKAGQNWKLAAPKEGQTLWLDTLAIGRHVTGEKLAAAYLLIDFMISAEIQKRIIEMYGSIIVNTETAKLLDAKTIKDGRVGDESFFIEEYFWKPLSSRTRNMYKIMWNKARDQ